VRRLISSDEGKTGFDRNPAPGIRDLESLVEQFREAGLSVECTIVGSLEGLPDDVGLCAYRIVQQALTNTLSHGGTGVSATVQLDRTDDRLNIEVVDDGLGAAALVDPDHHGRGVIGMRERVAVFGGQFRAEPRDRGGFKVAASIPVGAET
jgi:signal transduction histidine kinase